MAGIPHIAILGRPNVGKSTLFNRLVGGRRAIVDPTPGVTRDRIEGLFQWEGRNYRISDLAGWDEDPSNPFAKETTGQIFKIANEADVLILLVDGRDGPTAWDKALTDRLRTTSTPVILAVNKCDTVKSFNMANQFFELGIGEPIPISATHNLNVDVLLDRIAELTEGFDAFEEAETNENRIGVALVGRQNSGKSTLFNALVKDHRAIVSDIPGTTRDAVDTEIEIDGVRFLFIDTAGLKKQAKVKTNVDYYASRRTENALHRCEVALLLVDCTEGVTDTDLKVAGLIQKTGRACVIVASKWDESEDEPGHREKYEEHLRKKLHFVTYSPVVFTSGLKIVGIGELFQAIKNVRVEFYKKVATSEWNNCLIDAVTFRPPPSVSGKLLKLNYITQTGTAPPTVTIFTNQPDFMSDQYKRYLERFFRRRFGFDGSPLHISLRKKTGQKKERRRNKTNA
jgi:GTP-binding protein